MDQVFSREGEYSLHQHKATSFSTQVPAQWFEPKSDYQTRATSSTPEPAPQTYPFLTHKPSVSPEKKPVDNTPIQPAANITSPATHIPAVCLNGKKRRISSLTTNGTKTAIKKVRRSPKVNSPTETARQKMSVASILNHPEPDEKQAKWTSTSTSSSLNVPERLPRVLKLSSRASHGLPVSSYSQTTSLPEAITPPVKSRCRPILPKPVGPSVELSQVACGKERVLGKNGKSDLRA